MRYTGPKMKRVRKFGEEYALASDRAYADKFRKLQRKQPPGQHGLKRQFKKVSGYGLQLLEKQKLKYFYQLTEKPLRNYYTKASASEGSTSENLLRLLESRLDNVIYRAGLTDSHRLARQLVSHAHFALNGKKVDIPSIAVKAGDVISWRGRSVALKQRLSDLAGANTPVDWLKVDKDTLTIEVVSLPVRAQIDTPIHEQLVIEFYSR